MIDVKETLKKWHEGEPELSLDQLLGLLDGIVEQEEWKSYPWITPTTYPNEPIITQYNTCNGNCKECNKVEGIKISGLT